MNNNMRYSNLIETKNCGTPNHANKKQKPIHIMYAIQKKGPHTNLPCTHPTNDCHFWTMFHGHTHKLGHDRHTHNSTETRVGYNQARKYNTGVIAGKILKISSPLDKRRVSEISLTTYTRTVESTASKILGSRISGPLDNTHDDHSSRPTAY